MPRDYIGQNPTAFQRRPHLTKDDAWIREFLKTAKIGHFATSIDGQAFINPTTFWYDEENHQIVFHSNLAGRIRSNLETNPKVSMEASELGQMLPSNVALEFSLQYRSVLAFGTARVVTNPDEARRLLYGLIEKYFSELKAGQEYREISEKELRATSVYAIKIEEWSHRMDNDKKPAAPENRSIFIDGDVTGENVIIGDNNSINQTIIQKFFNIFKSDSESLELRNRRILLGHVENAWIKGVLDASLYGAAMLDLGIKETPKAITNQYPWTLKKESTDETLPVGTSMLEIFDSIGMGRSLLILGAPGSGKTTMLLELARGLIARAREDVTQPIPMVFNLASWTEKLTLADWLAQELNNLYSVPRKTAPDWVKGDKLLLLLDGLDEVGQESRAKCVDAINEFRKQNGLTSLAVCSRSQDYTDLNAKLSLEGAIEVQPLTQGQIAEFFNRFGKEMAGIKQALEKDNGLREMAETPLFLSIMLMTYRGKQDIEIWVSQDEKAQHKHLLNAYVERMFENPRLGSNRFKRQDTEKWLAWIGQKMLNHDLDPFVYENIQPVTLSAPQKILHSIFVTFNIGLYFGVIGFIGMLLLLWSLDSLNKDTFWVISAGTKCIWIVGLVIGSIFGRINIVLIDAIVVDWKNIFRQKINSLLFGWLFVSVVFYFDTKNIIASIYQSAFLVILLTLMRSALESIETKKVNQSVYVGGRIRSSIKSWLTAALLFGGIGSSTMFLINIWTGMYFVKTDLLIGFMMGNMFGLINGGLGVLMHYSLRLALFLSKTIPFRLVPFLDHCVDLIFLRRVGGGYIFVHRLLMEHFAEMYEGS